LGSSGFLEKAKCRVSESKVQYFPNWAEKEFFFQNLIELPNTINFPIGFTVTYAGNVGEAQDFPNVLETIKILKDYPISWIIVGDGRFKFKLEEEILKNNLQHKVSFYGNHPIELMPVIFQKSDVLFLSLKNDPIFSLTVPAKLQAYMASAKPVAAMISGEGKSLIQNSQCGFVVESGDYKGFSEIVLKLYSMDQSLRLKMGSKGKDYYMKNFDLKNREKQLEEILFNLN
jgi:glycosyltransferase involved in cell wall biosynthesis